MLSSCLLDIGSFPPATTRVLTDEKGHSIKIRIASPPPQRHHFLGAPNCSSQAMHLRQPQPDSLASCLSAERPGNSLLSSVHRPDVCDSAPTQTASGHQLANTPTSNAEQIQLESSIAEPEVLGSTQSRAANRKRKQGCRLQPKPPNRRQQLVVGPIEAAADTDTDTDTDGDRNRDRNRNRDTVGCHVRSGCGDSSASERNAELGQTFTVGVGQRATSR